MGTTAQKLEYLGTTKSQLKDMINYGLPTENQITNETTFRNYVKSIFEAFLESLRDSTTLYTNLPKISGNGTQITLNDTANAPMRITLNPSALSQDATPTPDSPQDIHTISGDNSVVVGNKNLWGGFSYSTTSNGIQFTYYKDGSVIANGTATGTATSMSASVAQSNNYLVTLEAGTYTLSGAFDGDKLLRICKKDGTTIKNSSSTTGDSFTLTEKTEAYIIVRIAQGQVCNNLKFYIQLEKGTTATTYEPYKSNTAILNLGNIEYCKIGDYEDEFILTSGKNLLETKIETQTKNGITLTHNTDGTYTINGTTTAGTTIRSNTYSKTLSSGTYTLSVENALPSGVYYSLYNNGTEIIATSYNAQSVTLTLNEETTYSSFADNIYINNGVTFNNFVIKPMLEKGTSVSSYEPYGTNQWYLKKNIGKVVLDGSENFIGAGTSGTDYRYNKTLSSLNIPNATTNNALCMANYFQNVTIKTDKKWGAFYINGNWLVFYDKDNNFENATAFNTWLSTHNTNVYYILSTPTYTPITGTLETQLNNIYKNMLSYKGTTNISQVNNDLPFVLGVSAIQDLE